MLNPVAKCLIGLAGLTLVAGCEITAEPDVDAGPYMGPAAAAAVAQQVTMVGEQDDLTTIVWGVPAENALASESALIATLEQYGVPRNGSQPLHAWIQQIMASTSPAMRGLGGSPAGDFLSMALEATSPGVGLGSSDFVTKGQIQEFSFDDATKSGRVVVVMTTSRVQTDGTLKPLMAHRWTVNVQENGYAVLAKDPSNATNAFPGQPLQISQAMASGFNYKIYAQGPAAIEIELVERKAGSAPNWTVLPPSNPLYNLDSESCIDMMFETYPPATLPADYRYCLGRCSTPPLVNTK